MKALLLFLILSITCFSQENDSLLFELNLIENDTERVNQLYKMGYGLRNSAINDAFSVALACEKSAIQSNSNAHLGKATNLLGILYYKIGNYSKAILYQQQSLQHNSKAHQILAMAYNYTNLGNCYSEIKKLDLAERFYLKALNSYNIINNKTQLTKSLINIGVLKYNQQQNNAALQQFKQALLYATDLNDYELMASCNNNTGAVYMVENDLENALIYLDDCEKYLNLTENEIELADCYNNYANVYIKKNELEKANSYICLTEKISTQNDYQEMIVELYDTKSLYYEKQSNYKEALFWNKKYHFVKDSLQNIEIQSNEDFIASPENEMVFEKKSNAMNYLISIILIIAIGISLFLFKLKR